MQSFNVVNANDPNIYSKGMPLKKVTSISFNPIGILFDQMITEEKYPGISRRISEIIYGLETSNTTSGNNVRETFHTHCLNDFHNDYSSTCTTERFSTGRLEKYLVDQLFLLVNWSCTANNVALVTELMILLGYESYEKKKSRFRQKMENELKKRRCRNDKSIHASRMKNPPKKTNRKQPKIKQEEVEVKQEELLPNCIKQEFEGLRSSTDYLGQPSSNEWIGNCTQYSFTSPTEHYPKMETVTNQAYNIYQNNPLTREVNTDSDDSVSSVLLLNVCMDENINAEHIEENKINPSSTSQTTNTQVDLPNTQETHSKNNVTSLEPSTREHNVERGDTSSIDFPLMEVGYLGLDIVSNVYPPIPQDELDLQPLFFNDQYQDDLFPTGSNYDQDIDPFITYGI